ncbi:MAG TPA: C1 family peptidase, partial [Polyangiaceae bacterium]|nr:C1 family peptidase [Polyangiaceae bacterium]
MRKSTLLVSLPTIALSLYSFTARAETNACRVVQGTSSSFLWCENELTQMSSAQRAARLMPAPSFPTSSTPPPQLRDLPNAVPTDPKFNWHNVGGDDWMSPVRDQKSCGSCFVFGTLGALESQLKVIAANPWLDVDLSEQSVISCITLGSCANGGTAEEVGNRLKTHGVPDEACYPYLAEEGQCSNVCSDWKERRVRIDDWHMSIIPWSVPEIKKQLVKTPVISQMQIYSDFYGYKSGVYSRSSSAKPDGWHVVTIVGWDDSDNSWIVRNSWGSKWGDGGYFKITRDTDCSLTLQGICFALHVNYLDVDPAETPGMPCLKDNSLHLQAKVGEKASGSVQITNCGKSWTVDVGIDSVPSWMTATLKNTNLGVGQTSPLTIEANAESLNVGKHEAKIRVYGGPASSTLHVTFDVQPQPKPDPEPEPSEEPGPEPTPEAGPEPSLEAGSVPDTNQPETAPPTGAAFDSDGGDDGCGCRTVPSQHRTMAWWALLITGL